ncbi:glycosyltransferase family 2 protein [Nocardioides dongkuii]|uniref:glycosyltransferase family 2 protein n=1 Tax=Nocardioides dongkuii TaxID=2760089 RepID=UPI0015FCAA35|nr:glycosyltransferase family 2 protein [Nocardioides dongkuii]
MRVAEVDVTVVVPVYNTMPYLTRTLDSLVAQSIGPDRMHVVAVDDGSTDGSGEELERYAAAHPGLFTVLHQENSGGPAGPCNRGLAAAEGRYVYFLGADDYLGDEALERMVDRADAWGSDVLCGRMVGVEDRHVAQRLYREDVEDLPFPDRTLVFAVSNTKLFRRSMLLEHGIRYPLDLKVGSDQPFTIEAMLRARRISVLASYECYYAVKRADSANISYSSTWRMRLADIGTIMGHVAELTGPGPVRDDILVRHFSSELAKLLDRDFPELPPAEQEELVAGLRTLADRYYTDRIDSGLRVLPRVRFHHLRAGRVDRLREMVGLGDADRRLVVGGERLRILYPGHGAGEVPDHAFDALVESPRTLLHQAVGEARLSWDGPVLRLEAPSVLHASSALHVRVVLTRTEERVGRPLLRRARPDVPHPAAGEVSIAADGTLTWSRDLTSRLPDDGTPRCWELRVQVDLGEHTYAAPVLAAPVPPHHVVRGARTYTLEVVPDPDGRALLTCVADAG